MLMKLSDWARANGISYKTAWLWWKRGKLPVPARQTPTGTILVEVPERKDAGAVLDRDENAARNLAALVAAVAGSGPETLNARGRDVRPAARQAVPEEAGSRQCESA